MAARTKTVSGRDAAEPAFAGSVLEVANEKEHQ
jgi:hypothetical protein